MNKMQSVLLLCAVTGATLLGTDLATYRDFRFGMDITSSAKRFGGNASDAKTLHRRPSLIQELDWRPQEPAQGVPSRTDPVRGGVLSFLDGKLYRIVVNYDPYKIEGLSMEDMVASISSTYGAATYPATEIVYHSNYGDTAAVLARWEDADYSYDLLRSGDKRSFVLVLYSKRLEALAQTAMIESARLDLEEAPQRELAKQEERKQAEQKMLQDARSVNLPNFRP